MLLVYKLSSKTTGFHNNTAVLFGETLWHLLCSSISKIRAYQNHGWNCVMWQHSTFTASTYMTGLECCSRSEVQDNSVFKRNKVELNNFYIKMWNASQQNIKHIYLEETTSTNTSDHGGHLWPSHQILGNKSSLKGENVTSLSSGSNTANRSLTMSRLSANSWQTFSPET